MIEITMTCYWALTFIQTNLKRFIIFGEGDQCIIVYEYISNNSLYDEGIELGRYEDWLIFYTERMGYNSWRPHARQ